MRISGVIILVLLSFVSLAQKQNNVWCFGNKAGIDFNGTPSAFTTGINSGDGVATASDRYTGVLLFYTDGYRVWNRTHSIMPGGTGLGNDMNGTCLQGSAIVPFTNDSNKYYIFTLDQEELKTGRLFYTVIDMTLNSGLGGIVTGQKKIQIGEGFAEGMAAVATCDGHWLILSSFTKNEFSAFRISAAGVDTNAIISQMPYPYIASIYATIKVSADANKILYMNYLTRPVSGQSYSFASIHDFDEKTGIISNGQFLEPPSTNTNYYSAEFSADGSKAYVCDLRKGVFQFDLSLPTLAAITASKRALYQNQPSRGALQLQRGPDSNIYIAFGDIIYVDRITNANEAFPNCVYTTNAITLAAGTKSTRSFPPAITYSEIKSLDTVYTATNVEICRGSSQQFLGLPGALLYNWQDNSSKRDFTVQQDGIYWVTSSFTCLEQTDTFKVRTVRLPINIGADTTICLGDTITVSVDVVNDSTTYLWQDGSTDASIAVAAQGVYDVTVSSGVCVSRDTINVAVNDSAYFSFGEDTILCADIVYELNVPEDVKSFTWNTGTADSVVMVTTPGDYLLKVERAGCSYADSISINYAEKTINIGNDTIVCDGEEVILKARSILSSTYQWSSGADIDSIIVSNQGIYSLILENRCGVFTDTATVEYKICDCEPAIPNIFSPNNDGHNDKFGPILKCIAATFDFMIINRFGEVVFKTNELHDRWDGTYKGQPADISTYYYQIKIKNTSGTDEYYKGDVVLIR